MVDGRGQANEGSERGGLLSCREVEDENDDEDENDAAMPHRLAACIGLPQSSSFSSSIFAG
jgi:hypothetical protein